MKMGTIYPSDSTSIQDTQATILPAGSYSVTLALSDPAVGIRPKTETLPLEVTAPLPAQIPTKITQTGRPGGAQPATGISVALILILIVAALLAGAGGTFGITTWRRRKSDITKPSP